MHRLWILALVIAGACNRSPSPSNTESATVAAAATPSSTSAVASSASTASEGPWYVGTWKGGSAATRRVSTTTTKQGAPAAWEKDDALRLSGTINIEISVDANGDVTGSIKGSLGDLGLRGRIDGRELRAILVAKSDEPNQIQNGVLVLARDADADSLKGQLNAATGDALAMRQAEVRLKKPAS
jgi:hypothetical protein